MVAVDESNFFDRTAGGYTIVDFWAAWCGPCRTFGPIFEEVARGHDGPVRFGACNTDENPGIANLVGVRSVPTVVVFGPDGSEVGRSGPLPRRQLELLVDRLVTRS